MVAGTTELFVPPPAESVRVGDVVLAANHVDNRSRRHCEALLRELQRRCEAPRSSGPQTTWTRLGRAHVEDELVRVTLARPLMS